MKVIRAKLPAYVLAVGLLLVGASGYAIPESFLSQNHSKVVIVTLPATTLADLDSAELTTIRSLMSTGAVGLMNSRTAGRLSPDENSFVDPRYTPESGYVTIGAGKRAIAGPEAREAFNRDEEIEGVSAEAIYARRMLANPGKSEVMHIETARLRNNNAGSSYDPIIGLLGSAARSAGRRTAVVGNSDGECLHREVVTLCMDESGLVDFGDVGEGMSVQDIRAPLGRKSNISLLLREARRCVEVADLVVVELGDMARLDRARLDLTEEVFERRKKEILRESDRTLGQLLNAFREQEAIVIVLSPYPASAEVEATGNSLCPVIASGPGVRHGLLTSRSTRVPGLVANTDIAPTVLSWLGVEHPKGVVGREITSVHDANPASLRELNRRVALQSSSQPMLRTMMIAAIVLVAIGTVLWLALPVGSRAGAVVLIAGALTLPTIPLSTMLMALIPAETEAGSWVRQLVLLVALVGVALVVGRRPARAFAMICGGFAALTVVDLASGANLCRFSIMGYSLIDGSRYYGIGNEYMGAFVGACAALMGILIDWQGMGHKGKQFVVFVALGTTAVVLGAPKLGANTGGLVAGATAFGVVLACTIESPVKPWRIALFAFAVAAVLGVVGILDALRGQGDETHLGKAVGLLLSGGLGETGIIVKRKLAMNLTLIKVSIWSRLILAYVISLMIIAQRADAAPALRGLSSGVRTATYGIIGGALAALVFNDSGIVAAATCFVYGWALLVLKLAFPQPAEGTLPSRRTASQP